ncbi:hypothetical protein DVT68_19490 [Dyella solisilvae]|uniref:Uncharacterized protein n=1 Tax=Dyella solisilvae TaxID=1920168 RepID=A0A370K2P2_9GAMM|nr:hypothetical protein [Dyella solisilvae]RDI96909.1 hypothetical protein DVT68_19490 [Dyella solisilvae]
MFQRRAIERHPLDADGIKLYTIAATARPVALSAYLPQLARMKQARPIDWRATPAFAICHDGASARYLVLGWWGNDNEMFVAVAVEQERGWIEDAARYSFCLWDMEVMWHERNAFVERMYGAEPSLAAYRASHFVQA